MLNTLITILCIIFIGYIIKKKFIANPIDVAREASSRCLSSLGEISYKVHRKNEQKHVTNKKGSFVDSWYYKLCEEILADLDMGDSTVEALSLVVIVISLVIGVLVGTLLRSLGLGIAVVPISYVMSITVLYMCATVGHYKRLFAFMDAETLIISTIDRGVYQSVLLNMSQFDPLVRPYFEEFVSNIEQYKMPFNEAIDILGKRVGPRFEDFKEKAKVVENNKRAGSEEVFNDNIKLNSKLRVRSIKLMNFIAQLRQEFFNCIILIVVFAVMLLLQTPLFSEWVINTTAGQVWIASHIILVAVSFAWTQSLRKDLKSKEAKKK